MKKHFWFFGALATTIPAFTIIAASCDNNGANQNKKNVIPNYYKDITRGLLSSSQLSEIKKYFSFSATKEGKEKSIYDLQKIIKKLLEKYKDEDDKVKDSSDKNNAYKHILNDPEFNNNFKAKILDQGAVYGHPIKIYFYEKSNEKDIPCLVYKIFCPDRPANGGKFSLEYEGRIYLEINK
ncbi:hypothetical protein [Metamycoplasma equirhinis]|uniref:hypothetical protein n=1 Tax=Metamycoplasma equirhinis TaxID=92402 RepID=UPI0035933DDD